MPPESISVYFRPAQSGEVRKRSPQGTRRSLQVSAVALVGRRACGATPSTAWCAGWAGGGPGRVSGRLLGPQEPCRVPPRAPGRPCGPLLTSEPLPPGRAGNRGQAVGLPGCCPAPPPARRSQAGYRHGPWPGVADGSAGGRLPCGRPRTLRTVPAGPARSVSAPSCSSVPAPVASPAGGGGGWRDVVAQADDR